MNQAVINSFLQAQADCRPYLRRKCNLKWHVVKPTKLRQKLPPTAEPKLSNMHCSSVQGKMHSPLFSGALQNKLIAVTVSLQLPLFRFALHTAKQ